jgi:outer membrane receptor for ferrienterochelin and colicins
MKLHLLFISLLLSSFTSWGQISGTVYFHEEGKTVSVTGANIYWEGTDVGASTDENGFYTLERVVGENVLVASFIGFQSQKKIVISRVGTINFTLKADARLLAEAEVSGRAKATQIDLKAAGLSYRIDETELRKAACCNLSESFETNASVDVSFSDAISGTKQIEMLGLSGKYALIQRENIPFVRGLNGINGLSYIPGPFIESIQLTKGLSSVINGYESITGQINAEYYKPETAPKFLLNLFGNQGGRSEINLLGSYSSGAHVSHATMLHLSTVPFSQDRNSDGFADITNGSQLNLLHRTHFHSPSGWEGQFGLNLVQDKKQGGEMEFLAQSDANRNLFWGFESTDERAEIFGKLGYAFQNEVYRSFGLIYSGSYQNRKSQFGQRDTKAELTNLYINAIFQDIIGTSAHKYHTGLSLLVDDYNEGLDSLGTNLYSHARQEIVPGAFGEYSFEPNENFTLIAGVRLDYNSYFEKAYFTPRLNLRYAIGRLTTLRLGGGRGQRTANKLAENNPVLASSRRLNFVNDEYRPEVAWNSGFSFDQFIPIGNKQLRYTADVFFTWFERKLVTDLDYNPNEAFILYQRGSRSLSFMNQIDFEPMKGLNLRLAYKYLRSEDQFLEGLNLAYQIPEHRAFLNSSYESAKLWKFDLSINWFGTKRLPNTADSPIEFQQDDFSPSFFTVDSQVNKEWKKFEFFAGVKNLFDFRQGQPIVNSGQAFDPYFDSNFIWGPVFGRNIYLGMYYKIPR